MQSILLTTPNKTSQSEVSNEKKIAKQAVRVETEEEQEKASERFFAVLENLIEVKEGLTEEVLTGEIKDAEDLLSTEERSVGESEDELMQDELVTNAITSEVIEIEDLVTELPLSVANETAETSQLFDDNKTSLNVESDPNKPILDSELQGKEALISPILAQIEAAQKTDAKVTESQRQVINSDSLNKSAKDSLKGVGKTEKLTFENVLADNSDIPEKELLVKSNLVTTEKLDNMLPSLKGEVNKTILNQNVESNVFNTLGMMSSSADKLPNQTNTLIASPASAASTLQSALQQPIDLHAKQASTMVGERIMMMIAQGKQEVTIRLDPAELGSMHIKLQVQQDQVQVTIQTQVGQSRDIIEQNLPRLREQFAQQGLNLSEASVEQQGKQNQSNSQASQQAGEGAQSSDRRDETFSEEQSDWISSQILLPAQGIDYYA